MRILYHHRTLGDGAEGIHIREMVKAFRELGHEVKVIGPTGEPQPESSQKSKILSNLKRSIPSTLYELLEIFYTGYCFLKMTREICTFKPNFIYDRYITFNAGTVLAGITHRVPVCLEVNAPLALERSVEQDERLFFRKIALLIEKWVCTHAMRTVVVSTPLKDYLESIGVPCGKCIVMPNGVNPEYFFPREKNIALLDQLGIPVDGFILGFTGVLRPWHGLDLLLTAVSSLVKQGRNMFLLIVGDGPYRVTIEKMVRELRLEHRVQVTGHIPHNKVPQYVSLFDVAISPRATFYASPMKVIEYMSLGKPVVVPATPNFFDIIDDGLNGITFEEGNLDALEQSLSYLYNAPDLRREIGVRARQKVERRLNWRWNANEVCQLFSI